MDFNHINKSLIKNFSSALVNLVLMAILIFLGSAAIPMDDLNGNSYTGITDVATFNFGAVDVTVPILQSSTPADDATNVTLSQNLTLTFDNNMVAGTGNITIVETGVGNFEQLDVTNGSLVSISTTTVTLNPSGTLKKGTAYHILIDATALDDDGGDDFAGIADATTLNFTTVDVVINEVVTDPQQDWSSNGFDGTIGSGSVTSVDEWIELFINSAGVDFTDWTIELNDGSDVTGDLTTAGAFDAQHYFTAGMGTFNSTEAGDYLVLGNVDGSGAMNNTGLTINLKDPGGAIVDVVMIGGGANEAPSGNASSTNPESVQRFTNGLDTDTHDSDFTFGPATIGAVNTGPSVTLSSSSPAIAENAGTSTITATLSAVSSQPTTVTVGLKSGGTATLTDDFTLSTMSIVIGAGSTTGTTVVTGVNDLLDDDSESLTIEITGVTNGTESGTQEETVTITDDDEVPTFTTLTTVVETTNEDTGVEITFAEIAAQGDEADGDGTVDAFVVQVVSTGTLTINGSAFATGTNDEITASKSATWTPSADTNGTLNAFTITAKDNDGIESANSIQATVAVTALDDGPTLTASGDNPTAIEAIQAATPFSSASASTVEAGQLITEWVMTVTNVTDGIKGNNETFEDFDGFQPVNLGNTFGTTSDNSISYTIIHSSNTRTITFTKAAGISTAVFNGIINGFTYNVSDNDPTEGTRVITITSITDNGSNSGGNLNTTALSISSTVTVQAIDTAPAINATGDDPIFYIWGSAVSPFSSVTTFPGEAAQTMASITFSITNVADGSTAGADEVINIDGSAVALNHGNSGTTATNSLSYFVTIAAGTATLVTSGATLSATDFSTMVDNLTYQNNAASPTTNNRVISITQLVDSGNNTGNDSNTNNNLNRTSTISLSEFPTIEFNATSSNGAESVSSSHLQVDLDALSALDATVDYAITGTATGSGTDFTLANGTLTISAGEANDNITIASIVDDVLDEANETVIVTLSNPSNANLGANTVHTYTINDDDAIPTIAFNSTASNAAESATTANLQVDLSAVSGQDVTVDYAITGTAIGGGTDYTLAAGTLTITAGNSSNNITIASIVEDALDETDETVIVTLSNPSNATLGTNTVHTYTINDDDATPTVAFTSTSSNGAESTTSANLQVALSAVSGQDVMVDYAVTGTATGSGTDYTLANGTLTISAGNSSNNITIASIIGDLLDEADETVIVTLSNPSNATLGTNTVHTYTINDDDATPTVAFTSTSSNGAESTTSANLQVALTSVSGRDVTVDYTVTGTATGSGTDYTLADGTLTISAGNSSNNITIASIIGDALDETDETVIVTLSNPSNATLGTNTVHTYTINDDDATPTVFFALATDGQSESEPSQDIQVSLSAVSGKTVTVDYAVTGTATAGGTDHTTVGGTITFNPGEQDFQQQIVGIVDDLLDEENETIILTLSNPTNATLGGQTTLTYTITDNDAEPTVILSVGSSSIAEAEGTSSITATLSAVSGRDVTVTLGYSGTATNGTDYNNTASTSITINAGSTSANAAIGLTATQDTDTEGNETIIIDITGVTNGTENGIQKQTVTLLDDDAPVVTSVTSTTANGSYKVGDVIAITVTFTQAITVTGTPQLTLEAGTTDRVVDFTSGSTTTTLLFSYTVQSGDVSSDLDYVGTGSLSLNGGTLKNGSAVDAILTLPALGSANSLAGNKDIIVDTSSPNAPAVSSITNDTGTNGTDLLTNDQTLAFNGSAEANSRVEVFIGGVSIGTAIADGSGNFSFDHTGTSLGEGLYSVTATATDAAGNVSDIGLPLEFEIDDVAPIVVDVTSSTADGSYKAGEQINVQVIFSEVVIVVNGPQIQLETGALDYHLGFVSGSGTTTLNYTFSVQEGSESADLNYISTTALEAAGNTEVKDAAGNDADLTLPALGSANSLAGNKGIIVDTSSPNAPTVSRITNDTGANSADLLTNDQTLAFNGTAEANSMVEVFIDAASIGTTTADGSGNWAFDHTATTLADGTYSLTAKATDTAGNTSAESTALPVTVDTAAPAAPVVTSITTDTGADAADQVTSENSLLFNGTAEAGASLEVFIGGVSIGTTTADGSGNFTFDYTGTTLADNTYQITAQATDAAGNASSASTALDVIVDTSAPAAPVVTGVTADTGTSSSDHITSDNTPGVFGTAEANSTVEIFSDASSIGTTNTDGSGNWSLDYSGTNPLADGVYVLTAKAIDIAGNTSAESVAIGATIDATAPNAPTIDLQSASDLGISDTDDLTNAGTPGFEGVAEPNVTITVFVDGENRGTTTTDGSGNWTLVPNAPFDPSARDITATATDTAGNKSSASVKLTVVYDNEFGSPLTTPADDATDVLPSANLVLSFGENANKGTGDIVIKQKSDDTVLETIDISSSKVTIVSGVVTIDPANLILPPATEFYVNVDAGALTDDAGNVYAGINNNTDWTFTIIAASTVNSVAVPTDGTYKIGENLDFTVDMILPVTITGTATIPITIGSTVVNATQVGTVAGSSTIIFRYTVLEDELDADGIAVGAAMNLNGGTMKDEFGVDAILTLNNVGATSAIFVDGIKPTATLTTPAASIVNAPFTVTFTYDEAVSNFELGDITVANGTASNFLSITTDQVWSATITPTASGNIDVSLGADRAEDGGGNGNNASNTVTRQFNTLPSDISLSTESTDENNAVGDAVATISTTDPDVGDNHTYALVSGTGDTDNGSFTIDGDQLKAGEAFDFEAKTSYSIRIKTDDGVNGTLEKAFAVTITNVLEGDIILTGDLDFGPTALGLNNIKPLTITNIGEKAVEVRIIDVPGGFTMALSSAIVGVGESVIAPVIFSPFEVREFVGELVAEHEDGQASVTLTGEGVIITGVDNNQLGEEDIALYPNPATSILEVDLSKLNGVPADIIIHDATGIQMLSRREIKESKVSIDVSKYNQGIYIMLIQTEQSIIKKKVIIRR